MINYKYMKKIYLALLFSIAFGTLISAQSFSLTNIYGNTIQNGDTITLTSIDANVTYSLIVWVTNNSTSTKYVKALRTEVITIPNSENYFCWGNCYQPGISLSIDSIKMESKYTEKGFSGDYNSNNNVGVTIIKYTFFDVENPSDEAFFFAKYVAGSSVGIDLSSKTYKLSNAYPNPANNLFNINYDLSGANKASVEIINIIGGIVRSEEINTQSSSASIDVSSLNNGVYFYNIIVDGRKIKSKKLIIQR